MRGLASFVMSGRYRALLVAIACSGSLMFGWIGAAVVALVTLRRGFQEGFLLLLWAALPALLLARMTGDSSGLALLLGTAVLAMVLRVSVSLALAALSAAAVAVLTGVGLLLFGEALLGELARIFEDFFRAIEEQARGSGSGPLTLQPPTRLQLAGMMGAANGGLSFLCLALGRHWQAQLYNPGGFGAEFRALRFPPPLVAVLLLLAGLLVSLGASYRSWAAAMLLPLMIGGFALLHAWATRRRAGSATIAAAYLLWLVFDAAKLAGIGAVAADALVNFRRRWAAMDAAGGSTGGARGGSDADGADRNSEDRESGEGEDQERRENTDRGDGNEPRDDSDDQRHGDQ